MGSVYIKQRALKKAQKDKIPKKLVKYLKNKKGYRILKEFWISGYSINEELNVLCSETKVLFFLKLYESKNVDLVFFLILENLKLLKDAYEIASFYKRVLSKFVNLIYLLAYPSSQLSSQPSIHSLNYPLNYPLNYSLNRSSSRPPNRSSSRPSNRSSTRPSNRSSTRPSTQTHKSLDYKFLEKLLDLPIFAKLPEETNNEILILCTTELSGLLLCEILVTAFEREDYHNIVYLITNGASPFYNVDGNTVYGMAMEKDRRDGSFTASLIYHTFKSKYE